MPKTASNEVGRPTETLLHVNFSLLNIYYSGEAPSRVIYVYDSAWREHLRTPVPSI